MCFEYKWSLAELNSMYLCDVIGILEALTKRRKAEQIEELAMKRIDFLIAHNPEEAAKILDSMEVK